MHNCTAITTKHRHRDLLLRGPLITLVVRGAPAANGVAFLHGLDDILATKLTTTPTRIF